MKNVRVRLLAVGAGSPWPEPLAEALREGLAQVESVRTLVEAAAILARNKTYRAVLMDPAWLTAHEAALLVVWKRHVNLPLWLLPVKARSARQQEALAQGAIAWENAGLEFAHLLQKDVTPLAGQGSTSVLQNMKETGEFAVSAVSAPRKGAEAAAQERPAQTAKPPEIPVAAALATGYDGLDNPQRLSEHEIRALLGNVEN